MDVMQSLDLTEVKRVERDGFYVVMHVDTDPRGSAYLGPLMTEAESERVVQALNTYSLIERAVRENETDFRVYAALDPLIALFREQHERRKRAELDEKATQAVAAGAALLDRRMPRWFRSIDLNALLMQHGTHCILGQTFGPLVGPATHSHNGYTVGVLLMSGSEATEDAGIAWAAEYGFTIPIGADPSYWEVLRCAWMNEIAKRQEPEQ